MKKYTVAITEVVQYLVPVEACNEKTAENKGLKLLVDSADRDKWCVAVTARDVDGVNAD